MSERGRSQPSDEVLDRNARTAADLKESSQTRGMIASLAKGLRILEYIASSPGEVRLRSVAAHFDMDRSAAFRILATLEALGYVVKDPETKAYSPGVALARLRRQARRRHELIEITNPFLRRLSEQTGQTGYLAILENERALLLEVAPGHNVVSVRHYVGQLEPLYCTSVGKAILALLPEPEASEILRTLELKKCTSRTISSKTVLRGQLKEIRASGVAFDECEWKEEICCIGVPILDETGYPVAAIGLSMVHALVKGGPRSKIDWIELIKQAASDAGAALATQQRAKDRDWTRSTA